MKALNLMLLVLLLAGGAIAQDSINTPGVLGAPGVEVIKNSWRRTVRNPALDQDPLLINEGQANLEKAQRRAIIDNAARAKADPLHPPAPIATRGSTSEIMPGGVRQSRPWTEYVHELKVRNTGTKTIRRVVWEYVLSDPGLKPQLKSRQYESKAKIRPGKTQNLVVRAATPPFRIINAARAGKNPQDESLEQLVMQRIEYDDGSVWVRDARQR